MGKRVVKYVSGTLLFSHEYQEVSRADQKCFDLSDGVSIMLPVQPNFNPN